jgi:hypothetical protein
MSFGLDTAEKYGPWKRRNNVTLYIWFVNSTNLYWNGKFHGVGRNTKGIRLFNLLVIMPTYFEIKVLDIDKTNTNLCEKVFVKIIDVSGGSGWGCWNPELNFQRFLSYQLKFQLIFQLSVNFADLRSRLSEKQKTTKSRQNCETT